MEKKQTAVEWLIENLPMVDTSDPHWKSVINIAKEMEKEQIIEAILYTIEDQYIRQTWANCESCIDVAEQYYIETYCTSENTDSE